MAKISTRLYGPAALTTSAATKFTVAASELNIIRHIHVSNPSGGALTFTCSIGADAAGTRIFDAYSIAAGSVLDHYGYYTMVAAEVFQALGSGTALIITVSGDRIVLG
jgi:hypothetical protein